MSISDIRTAPMDVPNFITGTGLTTVQGLDVASNWENLLAGRVLHETGIVPMEHDRTLPRVSQLAIHAARQALFAAGEPTLDDGRTALVVGTSKGPIEDWIDQLDGRRPPDIRHGVGQVAVDVAAAFGHRRGPRLTLAGACASGLHALIRAVDLIRQGSCDHALVVAAEASTHALFQANFKRLGVLATNEEGCRPFDKRRRGFLLAEAAAGVYITRNPPANEKLPRPAGGFPKITRTASFADASHLTGPDPQAAALSHALQQLITAEPIDLVHTHGTGTIQNDPAELLAIRQTIGTQNASIGHALNLYSHKHAIGHTQGAAGLIGVVINVEASRRQLIPGNANTNDSISGQARKADATITTRHASEPPNISASPVASPVSSSIAIAAGFGGTIAAVRIN